MLKNEVRAAMIEVAGGELGVEAGAVVERDGK